MLPGFNDSGRPACCDAQDRDHLLVKARSAESTDACQPPQLAACCSDHNFLIVGRFAAAAPPKADSTCLTAEFSSPNQTWANGGGGVEKTRSALPGPVVPGAYPAPE
jgi:hypothetical protein